MSQSLRALLPTLSSYAGPIPRLVVPILRTLLFSLSSSKFLCSGRINVALSDIYKFSGVIDTPLAEIASISFFNACRSKTTPFPIIDILSERKIPDGKIFNL